MKWTEEEEEMIIKLWKTTTVSQMANFIPNHSRHAISRKMGRIGIVLSPEDISWRKKYARSFVDNDNICQADQSISFDELKDTTIQMLIGSMLGDGCVTKQSKNLRNYRFTEGHCLRQSEYVVWKSNFLSDFKPRIKFRKNRTDLIALTHPIFTELRKQFYKPNARFKSLLPLSVVKLVNLFGLMVWFLDDGNYYKKEHRLEISATGWEYEGLLALSNYLNEQFNLSTYIYLNKSNKSLKIPAKDRWLTEEWTKLAIEKQLPNCMLYKLKGEKLFQ